MLDVLIIESIETIKYSKKKRPDEHTIHDILRKGRNLSEVKLADINDRLAFLIKEEKIENKPSYLIINNNPDTSYKSVSETHNATPTITTCPCANDLNSTKEHISNCTKMKFSIEDFFSKCDQIRSLLRIWSLLLKKSLIESFIFCAVSALNKQITAMQSFMLRQMVILKKISTTNIRYLPRTKFSIYQRTFRTDSSSSSRKQK